MYLLIMYNKKTNIYNKDNYKIRRKKKSVRLTFTLFEDNLVTFQTNSTNRQI